MIFISKLRLIIIDHIVIGYYISMLNYNSNEITLLTR